MPLTAEQRHQRHKEASRRYVAEGSQSGRDIARDYPPPGDMAARDACERDFRLFCETYFPNAFSLAWSDDHLKAIARMEDATLNGGLFALAMPRGSGKSTLSKRAAIWSLLYGHRRFVCLVAATEKLARDMLDDIKVELTFNERLVADFRQVCYPLQRLENNGRRCIGQLFDKQQTRIGWADDRLTFPTMPDSACDGANVSGSTISVAGLTGALRGQSHTLSSGTILRPEFVILDDPQTRESAMSQGQSASRAAIVQGDVLGMAGPGKKIAAIMPCTVIRDGDMAAEMLDRKRHPAWHGQRTKMVNAWPVSLSRWKEYWELRAACQETERDTAEATEFYQEHRAEMDAGAVVAWEARRHPDELSGLQHAMNLRQDLGEAAFHAECQNDPLPELGPDATPLSADQIASKLSRLRRGTVPLSCHHVTAFIDVQEEALYYAVAAWEPNFTGQVIDYGAFPDQKRRYFVLNDLSVKLSDLFPSMGVEGRIFAGLEAFTDLLLSREWPREDGSPFRIERCLIDSGHCTDTVLKFCRQSRHAAVIAPSKGIGIKPDGTLLEARRKFPGDRIGHHWRMSGAQGRGRHVSIDTNYWKSFLFARLAVAMGDRGCLSLYGDSPELHRMFADHLVAESCDIQASEKTGRKGPVWEEKPGRPDNHLLDCMVGCLVAASMQGVALAEASPAAPARRPRVSLKEAMQSRRPRPQP